jgi:hypothetical protein
VTSPLSFVWFHLVDSATGLPYKGTTYDKVAISSCADVVEFRKAVKAEYSDSHLKGVAPSNLLVYKNKAAFDKRNAAADDGKEEPLKEDLVIDSLGSSKEEALVVIVPSSTSLRRLDKLWSVEDIWEFDTSKALLNDTLNHINCDTIVSNLYRTIKVGQIEIRTIILVNNEENPHLLINNLSSHISETLVNLTNSIKSSNLLVLLGTSGCGKTRTIFEYLSSHFGFYFTFKGSREDQYIPGSSDFQFFLNRTLNHLKTHPLTCPDNTIDDNQKYVDRFLQCIFAARLYLFEHLRTKIGDLLTPELWLYIQLFPERIYVDSLFSDLVEILRHLGEKEMRLMLLDLIRNFPSPKLTCFLVCIVRITNSNVGRSSTDCG